MKKVTRNVPAALLRAQINDLTLEDIANSYEFKRIIENSINSLLYSHNRTRKTSFDIMYEPHNGLTACTDDFKCYLNAANPMFLTEALTGEIIPVKESVKRIYGASFHEAGHILYTCFSEMKRMAENFREGNLEPGDIPSELETSYNELNDVLKNKKAVVLQGFDAVPIRDFITSIYMSLMNCVEDGRIEKLLLKNDGRYSGLTAGLIDLRKYHQADGDAWEIEEFNIPVFMNLCLLYAKYGSFGKYEGGFPEFDMAVPILDKMVECHEAKKFSQYNQMLLLCIWPQIKDLIIEASGGSGEGEGEEGEGSDGSSSKPDSGEGSKGKGNAKGASSSSGGGSAQSEEASKELEKKLQEILDEIAEKISQEESFQNDAGETEQKQGDSDEGKSGADEGNSESGEGESDSGKSNSKTNVLESKAPANDTSSTTLEATIDSIMEQIADEKVREKAMNDACENAKKAIVAAGRGFAPYHGTKVRNVEPAYREETLDGATEAAIKKAAREIQRHLETDQRKGVSKRKFSGKKFHAEKVVNRDFRYFENTATKKEVPKVAVGLVVDESGSMHSDRRWKNARDAAITLYKIFEYIPNLDIAIYGHTTSHEVEIYDYTDFGIKQKDVPRRLSNISARGGNIDIVPVTVMAENLLKQDAESRIMFIITDGLPYSYVRGMTPEQELTEAANAYSRKGIEIIVASIGDDEARLKDIYRNQRFLNISSASDLPRKLVDVIKRKF